MTEISEKKATQTTFRTKGSIATIASFMKPLMQTSPAGSRSNQASGPCFCMTESRQGGWQTQLLCRHHRWWTTCWNATNMLDKIKTEVNIEWKTPMSQTGGTLKREGNIYGASKILRWFPTEEHMMSNLLKNDNETTSQWHLHMPLNNSTKCNFFSGRNPPEVEEINLWLKSQKRKHSNIFSNQR